VLSRLAPRRNPRLAGAVAIGGASGHGQQHRSERGGCLDLPCFAPLTPAFNAASLQGIFIFPKRNIMRGDQPCRPIASIG
jgi:hypothetical protein